MTEQMVLWLRLASETKEHKAHTHHTYTLLPVSSSLSIMGFSKYFYIFFGFVIRSPGKVTAGPVERFCLGCGPVMSQKVVRVV